MSQESKSLKIGITGQSGFVGTHLFNSLGLYPNMFECIQFKDEYFQEIEMLRDFVSKCDVIVHLAAMNRHNDPQVIYETNIGLVKQVISACEETKSTPHILFSSSTQEERDNLYGKSKQEGRLLLEEWAMKNKALFTGLIIPNVFGPFGQPYYNSVIATFCHQLTRNETPKIDVDGNMKLIYVGELVDVIIENIKSKKDSLCSSVLNTGQLCETINVPHSYEIKVSKLLKTLTGFKDHYFSKGMIPSLDNPFTRNLFNTFVCYIDHKKFFPFNLELKTDDRGSFVEIVKLNSGGQISFSTTKPGVTRGNHFHTHKAERFAVIKGNAQIELRRIGDEKVLKFRLEGNKPAFVDMPIWYTHKITNIGEEDVYTIFWISEHYDSNDPDTFIERV